MPVTASRLRVTTGGRIYFELRGLDELQRNLEALCGSDLDEEMEAIVQEELDSIREESQKIVPVDTGALHDSAFTYVERVHGHLDAAIGYDTPYAVYVHEDPDARHKPGKQWKYLETPLMEAQPRFMDRVASAVRRWLAG